MKKKLIVPIALLLAMLLCMPAMAATVCKIGSKGYSKLQDAVNAVKDGQTIVLTKAIKTSEMVCIESPDTAITRFTIDFKNKKYTYSGYDYAFLLGGTKRTITFKNINFKVTKGVMISGMGRQNLNTLVIENGTYVGGPISITEGEPGKDGGLLIKDGKFTHKGSVDYWLTNRGQVEILNGTFNGCTVENFGECILSGGKWSFSGFREYTYFLNHRGGRMTVSGGTYTGTKNMFFQEAEAETTIKGGTINTPGLVGMRGKYTITGGTFNCWLTCREGEMTISGGTCTGVINVADGGKITINNMTVKTKIKYDWVSPDYFVCLNADGNGSININGGSFTAKGGYGYKKGADATITFGVSNPASLFKVKKLELK